MALLDMFGAGAARRGGGMSPLTMGLLGLLAYRTLKGKGRLADMLGTGQSTTTATGATGASAGAGGLGGLLSGGALGSGLRDLLDRFRSSGHDGTAQSWVTQGPNQPIAPEHLEQVLGEERLQWLMQQTGLPKDQLLAGLSQELPQAVDRMTPEGRLPTDDELNRMG